MGKSYYKWIYILYTAALVFCGGVRIVLHLRHLDIQTGFYDRDQVLPDILFKGVLYGVLAALFLLSMLKRVDHDYLVETRRPLTSLLLLPLGAAVALYAMWGANLDPILRSDISTGGWRRFFIGLDRMVDRLSPYAALGWGGILLGGLLAFFCFWGMTYETPPYRQGFRPLLFLSRHKAVSLLLALLGLAVVFLGLVIRGIRELEYLSYQEQWSWLFNLANRELGLVAGAGCIQAGYAGLRRNPRRPFAILVLMPVLWQLLVLMSRFHGFNSPTHLYDNLLCILYMCFASIFYVGQARVFCGLAKKNGRNYAIPAGLATSLCGFLLVIPHLVYMAVKRAPFPSLFLNRWECLYVLVLSVYSLVFVRTFCRDIKYV